MPYIKKFCNCCVYTEMIWLRCFDVALILYIEIFAATATALVCTDGDIRLTASFWTTEFYIDGIVEVCFNNTWGTVCDHNWDKTDSIVVCNQLGYYDGAIAYVGSRYGPGTGPIQMDYVDCVGNETSLIFCPHNSSTNMSSCNSHLHDAGVSCYNDFCYGTIRLIGPESPYGKGRVELCLNKKWGSICDNNWDENDARVVCKQLGFNGEAIAYVGSYFGAGTGPIQMDNVNCIGNETSVSRCPRSSSINMSSCNSHLHDAGVSCSTVCPSGGIRLVGNFATNSKGTVELCLNNTWGTICDYNWDDTDASVVCNQLGYYGQSTAYRFSYLGSGTGPYLMDYVDCNGSETSLVHCARSNNINASLCNDIYHVHDAGVSCTKGGSCAMFTMCCPEDAWDCYGTPPTCLCDQDCYNRGDCCRDIGNSCLPLTEAPPTIINCSNSTSHVSLAGYFMYSSTSYAQGTVEFCYNNIWGTVCGNNWDSSDANVVCKELGYYGEAIAYTYASFGVGIGPIVLNNVSCLGNESSLHQCASTGVSGDCAHTNDAGVRCYAATVTTTPITTSRPTCIDGAVHLVGPGSYVGQGTVEMCYNNTWGTVCADAWDLNDANVVCTELGYYRAATAYGNASFGEGTGSILVNCIGTEGSLIQCAYKTINNCSHRNDAGVACLLRETEAPPTKRGTATAFTAFGLTAALCIGFIVMMTVPVAIGCVLYHKKRRQISTSPTGVDFRYTCIVRHANTCTDVVDQSTCTQPMVQNESLYVSHPLPHSHSLLHQPLPPYPHSSPPPAYPASEYELGCINSHSSSADQDPPPPYNSLVIYNE